MANNYMSFSFRVPTSDAQTQVAIAAFNALERGLEAHFADHDGFANTAWGADIDGPASAPGTVPDASGVLAPEDARDVTRTTGEVAALAVRMFCAVRDLAAPDVLENVIEGESVEGGLGVRVQDFGGFAVYTEESGDAAGAAALATALIEHFGLEPVGFEWAETCSAPRIGEFGGGAVLCAAGHAPRFESSQTALQRMRDELAAAPAPGAEETSGPTP